MNLVIKSLLLLRIQATFDNFDIQMLRQLLQILADGMPQGC